MVTTSPSAAARSTVFVVANRSRSASICSSTSESATSRSSTVTAISDRSGISIFGRTSTSAVNARVCPSSIFSISISGWPSTPSCSAPTASLYLAGTASLTTSVRIVPRPSRASRMRAGTLPGRKPGTRTCPASVLYALSKNGFSSSNSTSTVSLTRVGLTCSTVLFTYFDSSPDQ